MRTFFIDCWGKNVGLRFHRVSCHLNWNSIERMRSRKEQCRHEIEHAEGLYERRYKRILFFNR
jgi:hypothetical protein